MNKWFGFADWARRDSRAGDRLPYAGLVNEHTLMLRDGSLMQSLHVTGFAFETAETAELNHRHLAREAALRAIANSRYVVHHHILRRRIPVALEGDFIEPVCALIDQRWRDRLSSRSVFVNDLFVSIVRRPRKGKAGAADRGQRMFARRNDSLRRAGLARDLRELDSAREALAAGLQPYGARLLAGYDGSGGRYSEPLELVSALYNGELRPMLAPECSTRDAGHHIPYRRISFGLDAIERRGAGAERDYSAVVSLKEYPPSAAPGMLDALLRLPYEMTISESFGFVDRQVAQERISLALRRSRAADDDSQTLRRGLFEAKDDVASGKSCFGEHAFSLLVRTPTLEGLDGSVAEVSSALADLGAVPVREDLALEPAYWGQFPGNEGYVARKALISSGAFAGFASLHGFPIGEASGNHWGPAVTVFETTSATPYFFNFHEGDLGNFTIIGPSGSGKTVVLNFLAAQAQKFAPRTVIFDKDRGSEIFVRAIGGHYATIRAGERTGFNPLQLPDTPANRAFLRTFIARLVSRPGQTLSTSDEAVIAAAIDASFDQDVAFRRLRFLSELLGGGRRPSADDLPSRLAPWIGNGSHAWLFDNDADRLDVLQPILGFDMTELLDDAVLRTPAMMYLFHRIEQRLDGSPTMILIDEGWKALDDPIFAARIRDWMKTLRKRNAILGFGTQSARDALDSSVSAAIIEQAATNIFMPNARATHADYCEGFGLTEHELGLIQGLPAQSRCFLVKHGAHSVIARLDLSDAPDLVSMFSGREASVRRLDDLRRRQGDHPFYWWSDLLGTPYPGAAPETPRPTLRSVAG